MVDAKFSLKLVSKDVLWGNIIKIVVRPLLNI